MRKLLALVLALVMTLGLATVGASATAYEDFKDVDEINYEEAVAVTNALGIWVGTGDDTFKPTNTMDRASAAKVIAYLLWGQDAADQYKGTGKVFKDLPADHWACGYMELLNSKGIMVGYEGNVYPYGTMKTIDFAKMLLVALGFDAEKEGFVGDMYQVNVAAMAKQFGLFVGNDDVTYTANVTREEASLYTFNMICSPMVKYPANSNDWEYNTTTAKTAQYRAISNLTVNGNDQAQIVEFGEDKYAGLTRTDSADPFGRPASKWAYNNKAIGEFVNEDYLVETYTAWTDGATLNALLGDTAIKNSNFTYRIDGKDNAGFTKAEMARTNTDTGVGGRGVLTQVWLIPGVENNELYITEINTYYAVATADYNKDNDELRVAAYPGGIGAGAAPIYFVIDGAVVPAIADVKKGDKLLVNAVDVDTSTTLTAADTIVNIDAPKAVNTGLKLKAYSIGTNYHETTEGVKTQWAATCSRYDTLLGPYNNGALDFTYTEVLGLVGDYAVAVIQENTELRYVFISAFDTSASNIALTNVTANAIFLDGSMKQITVNAAKSDLNINVAGYTKFSAATTAAQRSRFNQWFSYVESNGVYTLSQITDAAGNAAVGAYNVPAANTDTKYADLFSSTNAKLVDAVDNTRVGYGNDNTAYIAVGAKVNDNNQDTIAVVNGAYTGVQGVEIKLYSVASDKVAGKLGANAGLANGYAAGNKGLFFCYDKAGYLIGVVALGKDTANTKNYAFAIGGAQKEYTDGTYYYWDFSAVFNGELKTMTIKGDDYAAVMAGANIITANTGRVGHTNLYEMAIDKDGYVKTVTRFAPANTKLTATSDDVYSEGDVGAGVTDLTTFTAFNLTYDDTTAIDARAAGQTWTLSSQGNTLYAYASTSGRIDPGLVIKQGAPIIVRQYYFSDGVGTTTGYNQTFTSIAEALSALVDANPATNALDFQGEIAAAINKDNGVAEWVVIKSENGRNTTTTDAALATTPGNSVRINVSGGALTVNGVAVANDNFQVTSNLAGTHKVEVYRTAAGGSAPVKVYDNTVALVANTDTTIASLGINAATITTGTAWYMVIDGTYTSNVSIAD